jgi:hypothetical protein
VLDSISAYYYTGAIAALIGLLFALSLFLITYRGYNNKFNWADRLVAITGGLAALGVAFFPTNPPVGMPAPVWLTHTTVIIHYTSAILLLIMFALFSLWLFRLQAPGEQSNASKRRRNRIFLVCGIVIVGSIVSAGICGLGHMPIFLPESIALEAFAVSWLVKGYAHETIADIARSIAPALSKVLHRVTQ